MQKIYNIIVLILLLSLICACAGFGIQSYRLEQTRHELESIRVQYAAAKDQQRELREIIRGTDELLSESFDTISGIRSQITAIRESYEQMESIINSSGSNSANDNIGTNYETIGGLK